MPVAVHASLSALKKSNKKMDGETLAEMDGASVRSSQRDVVARGQAVAQRFAHGDRGEATKKKYRSCLNKIGKLMYNVVCRNPGALDIAAMFEVHV